MESLKVIYRSVIMLGTLAVGGLAFVAYGPELEKLSPVVERLKEAAAEWLQEQGESSEIPAAESNLMATAPPELSELGTRLTPLEQSPPEELSRDAPPLVDQPLVDQQVRQASLNEQVVSPPAVAASVARLQQLGVAEYSLSPWGSGGTFYRFQCSAPWGSGGQFTRQFEAIADNPAQAARQVLEQIEAWRTGTQLQIEPRL